MLIARSLRSTNPGKGVASLPLPTATGTMSSAPPTTAAPSLPNPRSAATIACHSWLLKIACVLPSR